MQFVMVEAPANLPLCLLNPSRGPYGLKPDQRNLVVSSQRGKPMKASNVKSFSKKLACPSSSLLLSFEQQALAPEINFLIKHHLAGCDFCYCEIPLLAFYSPPLKGECRAPELPINLKVLAEFILAQDKSAKVVCEASAGPTFIEATCDES